MGSTPAHCLASPVRVLIRSVGSPPGGVPTSALRSLLAPFSNYVTVANSGTQSGADLVLIEVASVDAPALAGISMAIEQHGLPALAVVDADFGDDERLLLRVLRTGAGGCIRRPDDGLDLVEAIVAVTSGDTALDQDVAARALLLAARLLDLDRSPADLVGLSRREVDVLERLESGATARQIGEELFVSHETVRSHLKRVYRKLGVHDRSAAIERARLDGILTD